MAPRQPVAQPPYWKEIGQGDWKIGHVYIIHLFMPV